MANIIHAELSYRIMGAIFAVHKELGPGFVESVYEKALVEEFRRSHLKFEQQKPVNIDYKGIRVESHKMDLIIEDKIVLELKTVDRFCTQHSAQLLSYLKATGYKLGILVNFSKAEVEYKRILNSL